MSHRSPPSADTRVLAGSPRTRLGFVTRSHPATSRRLAAGARRGPTCASARRDSTRRHPRPADRRHPRLALLGAVSLGVPELAALLDRRLLELRAQDVTHGLDPVGHEGPLLPVPLLDESESVPLVVLAARLHRPHQTLEAEVLQ